MTGNVQLAMLMPVQTRQQAERVQRSQDNRRSETETVENAGGEETVSRDGLPADHKRNTFDRVLNEKLEEPVAAQEPATPEPSPEWVGSADALLFSDNGVMAAIAAEFSAVSFETGTGLPQDNAIANSQTDPAAAMLAALSETALPRGIAEQAAESMPEHAKETVFSALLKGKPEGVTEGKPAAEQGVPLTIKPQVIAPTEPLPVQAGKQEKIELPVTETKPPMEKMPVLPEQAVVNTLDKPAAINSPVFAAQPKPMVENVVEAEKPGAVKMQAGLKKALQTKIAESPAAKEHAAVSGTAFETAGGGRTENLVGHAAGVAQHKPSELNITETKVTGSENVAAVRLRAGDAIAASRPAEQIAQSLPAGPVRVDQQIRLTLTPPELGTVRITFREQDSEIVGLVEVQKSQTRQELEESLPQLVSAMQNQGMQVRRIEVVQWNTPQQGTRESLSENYSPSAEREFMQQGSGSSNERPSRNNESSVPDEFGGNERNPFATGTPEQKEWFSDKSLNLYI